MRALLKQLPVTGKSYVSYVDEWDAYCGRFVDDAPCVGCASAATVLWLCGTKLRTLKGLQAIHHQRWRR